MTDMEKYSDEQLSLLFQAGDEAAGSELASRYRPLIKRCTRPYFLLGGDGEDLIQEGMIGLVHSMQSFDIDGAASFKSYAEVCIRRRILDAIKAAGRLKHMPLNSGLSLEELKGSDEGTGLPLADGAYIPSPEELIIEQEEKSSIYTMCRSILSPLERKVLSGYLEGLSYEEIAARCEKPVKSVDSALQRIRRKLAAAFSD